MTWDVDAPYNLKYTYIPLNVVDLKTWHTLPPVPEDNVVFEISVKPVQVSVICKHARAFVAEGVWSVAYRFLQKLRNLLVEFCIDNLMKHKMFTYVFEQSYFVALINTQFFTLCLQC